MDICNNFNFILDNYSKLEKVDKNSEIYQCFKKLAKEFKFFINHSDIDTGFGIGRGKKALVPCINIYSTNKKIRKSAQEGIYLVYLFRADMEGFYLALSQGITYFIQKYGNNNYARFAARKLAEYYAKSLPKPIDLNIPKDRYSIGREYQEINIATKYYEKDKFTYDELKNDLIDMLKQYDEVICRCNEESWYHVLEKIAPYDEIELSMIKAKGNHIKKETDKAPVWFIKFRDEQRAFNTRIEKDIANLKNDVSSLKKTQDQQNKHLQRIDSRLDRQDERFENIEHELSIMAEEKQKQEAKLLKIRIGDMNLSVRSFNCLKHAGIQTVQQLIDKPRSEVKKIKNLGRKSLREIQKKLLEYGLTFKEESEDSSNENESEDAQEI